MLLEVLYMRFKSNLRVIMALRRIDTIKDLAVMCNLSVRPLSSLYNEINLETMKLGTLMKVCDALKCNLDELIEYPDKSGVHHCEFERM